MSDKASRLLRIYSRLRRGPVTIEVIKQWARKNDIVISDRSLYRDLKEIEQSILFEGEKLVVTEGEKNKKTWKIEFVKSTNNLTDFDINSFLLFKNFAPLALVSSRSKSLEKIENLFYTTYSKGRFEKLATIADLQITGTHFYDFSHAEDYQQTLEDCIWCVQNKRELNLISVCFDYTSIGSSIKFPIILLPLQILYHRGCIHLAGMLKNTNKLIIIALEQIQQYELTNIMFDRSKLGALFEAEMNKRFGITENIDDKVYEIEIEFSELTGNFVVNHFWHKTQKFTRLSNGNFSMKLTCGINRELVGWIFQWMSNARVAQPDFLQTLIKAKLEEISNCYTKKKNIMSNNHFRAQ